MSTWRGIALAAVLCGAPLSVVAQATISAQVTFSSDRFDIRAVDPAGTAFALNLPRGTSEIWASTDNARTFTFRGRLPAGTDFKEMTTLRDGTLLADTQTGTTFAIYRSTDHGATWAKVLDLGQYRWLTPHNVDEFGSTVYFAEYQAFTGSTVPVRLRVSTDRGATWTVRHTFTTARHAHGVRVDASGNVWVFLGDSGTQAGTFRSTDGGVNFTQVLSGQEGRINDAVFVGQDILFGQDIPSLPPQPSIARLTPSGVLTKLFTLPGPSYSIHQVGSAFLVGETREINGDVYPPGDVSAHLFGSADGVSWVQLGAFPRVDATDYARADVYWVLPSGEVVLNLRHVTTLASGRGFQLLRLSTSTTPPPTGTSFSDNFDACTTTTSLGPNWDINGTWYCKVGRARGETGGTIALARTADLGDTDVAGLVQLNTSDLSGLVARAANGSFYGARLNRAGRIEAIRVGPGSVQVLGSANVTVPDSVSFRLRLRVTGTNPPQLEVLSNGTSLFRATDPNATPLTSGRAGLLHGSGFRTQFDDFAVTGTPPAPPVAAAFSDNFDACTSATDLGANWSISGTWYCRVGRARGETNGGLATVRPALGPDQDVSALVQLNGTADGSGVVARAAAGHFYLARILRAGRLEIVRVDNGAVTVLGTAPGPIVVDTSFVVGLRVSGSSTVQLTASIAGKPVLSATDSSANRLTNGSPGLFSAGATGAFFRTQYDNFVVR